MLRMGRNDHWTKATLRQLGRPPARRASRMNKSLIIKAMTKNLAGRINVRCSKIVGFFYKKDLKMKRSVGCCDANLR